MTGLVRAELWKLLTTRTWVVLAVSAVLLVLLNLTIAAVFAGWRLPGGPVPVGLMSAEGVRSMHAAAAGGTVFAVLLGALAVTGEFRHGTATYTYLTNPRRARVATAKVVAYLLVGAALGVLVAGVCVAGTQVALAVGADPVSPLRYGVPAQLGGAVGSYALHAVVGVGVGFLLRNQVVAIVTVVVWTQVVEGAVVALVPDVGRWLLTGAGSAVVRYGEATGLYLHPAWVGALLLLAYAAAAAAVAYGAGTRKDVT